MTVGRKTRKASALGLIGVDRECRWVLPSGIGDIVCAAGYRFGVPFVVEIEDERGLNADGGMETGRGLPCAIADARNVFADGSGRMQGHRNSVTEDLIAWTNETGYFDLEAFE